MCEEMNVIDRFNQVIEQAKKDWNFAHAVVRGDYVLRIHPITQSGLIGLTLSIRNITVGIYGLDIMIRDIGRSTYQIYCSSCDGIITIPEEVLEVLV